MIIRASQVKTSSESFWETRYFPPLDGLRAVSLLLVIASHCHTSLPVKRYFSGGLGVGIFFVLSGFLITLLLLREESEYQTVSFGRFYIRRTFRILPAYGLTIVVYLVLGMLPSQHALKEKFLNGLPWFLTLRNEYLPPGLPVAFTHSWSLSVEEKFYFVWPLLFFWLLKRLRARRAAVLITLAPLTISMKDSLPVAYFSLLLGCLVAIVLHRARLRRERILETISLVPMWLAAGMWIGVYFAALQPAFRVGFIVMTAVILPLLLLRETWLSVALGSRICVVVGKRTYSMYLLHAICLTFVERLLPPVTTPRFFLVLALAYGVSLAAASLVYAVLEKPATDWGRSLAARYRRRAEHAIIGQKPEHTAFSLH